MYNENDFNEFKNGGDRQPEHNTDSDVNYTEGSYTDNSSEYSRKNFADVTGGGCRNGQPDRSYIPPEPEASYSPKKSLAKRAAGIAAAGILFGCVAGGTMAGVNALSSRYMKSSVSAEVGSTQPLPETMQSTAAAEVIATSMGNDVSAIVDKAMPSVVAIDNTMHYEQEDWFFGTQSYEVPNSGSGIIAGQNDTELLIVTNNHVVQDSTKLSVSFIDGTSVEALVKGTDSDSDLAVIAVKLSDIPEETRGKIKPAALGDSDALKLGQGVVAIGNALGQGQAVTVGYVSALGKTVTVDGVERQLMQVDAAINPGNSGGALLNMNGDVIGINAAKYSATTVEGMGYAIPISFAKNIIDELMNRTTKVELAEDEQGYLGIQLQNIDSQMSQAYGMPQGIYVFKIIEGGAASNSDLRERDIITKIDGETVRSGEDLQKMLTYFNGGSTVTLTVQSLENGAYVERKVDVKLAYKKDNSTAGSDVQQNSGNRSNSQNMPNERSVPGGLERFFPQAGQ